MMPTDLAEKVWECLKARCAATRLEDQDKVKALVMVRRDDIHAAITAAAGVARTAASTVFLTDEEMDLMRAARTPAEQDYDYEGPA